MFAKRNHPSFCLWKLWVIGGFLLFLKISTEWKSFTFLLSLQFQCWWVRPPSLFLHQGKLCVLFNLEETWWAPSLARDSADALHTVFYYDMRDVARGRKPMLSLAMTLATWNAAGRGGHVDLPHGTPGAWCCTCLSELELIVHRELSK